VSTSSRADEACFYLKAYLVGWGFADEICVARHDLHAIIK